MAKYEEPEITREVQLCKPDGTLNRSAVGWTRHPMHVCNLSGRRFRKKRWNYWCVLDDNFAFSPTLANIDYIGIANASILDFNEKEFHEKLVVTPFGSGFNMPDTVEKDVSFDKGGLSISIEYVKGGIRMRAECAKFDGGPLSADITIEKPAGHQTLSVVIPWNDRTFQYTSKQNCMSANGFVKVGGRERRFTPGKAFAVLDYGRGIWPTKTTWNWASFSSKQGDDLVGINLGSKWTDGTGMNENGIFLNGVLYKVSEDLVVEYDRADFMRPWRLRTEHSNMVDLTLTPFYERKSGTNLIFLGAEGHQMFGRYTGVLNAGGREVRIDNVTGWAEEHISTW